MVGCGRELVGGQARCGEKGEGVREKGAEQGVGLGLGLGSVWSRGVQQEGWECVRGGGGGSGAGWRQVDDWGLGGMGVF